MENKKLYISDTKLKLARKRFPNIPFNDSNPTEEEKLEFFEKVKIESEAELVEFLRKKKLEDSSKEPEVCEPEESILRKIFVLFMMTFFRSFYLSLKYERYYLGSMYKLISGILMLSASCYFIFSSNDYMHNSDYKHYGDTIKGIVCITVLVWFVKGAFRIGTFNSEFSHTGSGSFVGAVIYAIMNLSKPSESSTPSQTNIDRAISYRNARLGQLSGWEAADLLAKTSVLDTMKNGALGDNINLNRAASNLNAKLGGMTGFEAVDYIAGKK